MVRLKSAVRSDYRLDLFQVVPGSTPWLRLYIANQCTKFTMVTSLPSILIVDILVGKTKQKLATPLVSRDRDQPKLNLKEICHQLCAVFCEFLCMLLW